MRRISRYILMDPGLHQLERFRLNLRLRDVTLTYVVTTSWLMTMVEW